LADIPCGVRGIDYEWTGAIQGVVQGYVNDLGSNNFRTREAASAALLRELSNYFSCLGYEELQTILYAIDQVIGTTTDPEVRRRRELTKDALRNQYYRDPVCSCGMQRNGG